MSRGQGKATIGGIVFCVLAICQLSAAATFVRVLHASPEAPEVDVYVFDSTDLGQPPALVYKGLNFSTMTTSNETSAGNKIVVVVIAGRPVQEGVVNGTAIVTENNYHTIAVIGMVTKEPYLSIVCKRDRVRGEWRKSSIRFVNFAPEMDHMDVFKVVDQKQTYVINRLPYGLASNYCGFAEDEYEFHVALSRSKSVYLFTKGLYLSTGYVYSYFVIGLIKHGDFGGEPRLAALVTDDSLYEGNAANTVAKQPVLVDLIPKNNGFDAEYPSLLLRGQSQNEGKVGRV